jgi:hypothetical protein
MMGERQVQQDALFYEFSLERHVPEKHLLRAIVHLNLGYRWFCRLGLDGDVPDHSTFSKTRHGRFRDADLLRELWIVLKNSTMDADGCGGTERLSG